MDGAVALKQAKNYVDETLKGLGALKGQDGKDGTDGKSAYQVAIDNGYTGTETDWLNSLKGDKGDSGTAGNDGQDGKDGKDGKDGADGKGISSITKISTESLTDTYQITFTDGTTFNYTVKNGETGAQGLKGEKGEPGNTGQTGLQGIQGEKGDDGYPFLIYKEYNSLSDFNADDFPEIGLMFMIKEKDENNSFPIYRYTGEEENSYSYITGLSNGEAIKGDRGEPGQAGEQGIPGKDGKDGVTYTPKIGTVTTILPNENASATVTVDEDKAEMIFNLSIPQGKKGDTGDDGTDGTTPHIDATSKHWMLGTTDTGVVAEGTKGDKGERGSDGVTPHVGDNGNWWFDDKDSKTPIPSIEDLLKYVEKTHGTPVGEIISYMGTTAPSHYLICNGATYNISDYPDLANHFKNQFGSANYFGGDGTTTFAVPDLRGEFLRGSGTATRNTGSGASVGKHQEPTKHVALGVNQSQNTIWMDGRSFSNGSSSMSYENGDVGYKTSATTGRYVNFNSSWSNAAGWTSYSSRPTNTAVLFCIKCEPIYSAKAN